MRKLLAPQTARIGRPDGPAQPDAVGIELLGGSPTDLAHDLTELLGLSMSCIGSRPGAVRLGREPVRLPPQVVLRPRDADDVAALFDYCRRTGDTPRYVPEAPASTVSHSRRHFDRRPAQLELKDRRRRRSPPTARPARSCLMQTPCSHAMGAARSRSRQRRRRHHRRMVEPDVRAHAQRRRRRASRGGRVHPGARGGPTGHGQIGASPGQHRAAGGEQDRYQRMAPSPPISRITKNGQPFGDTAHAALGGSRRLGQADSGRLAAHRSSRRAGRLGKVTPST